MLTAKTAPTQPGVGDRVKYRREWLRSVGCVTGDMPFARGAITALQVVGTIVLATIAWDGNDPVVIPTKANVNNLTFAHDPERV